MGRTGRRPGPEDEGTPAAETGERAEPEFLAVGHVTKAHGTKGEVFVWPLTDTPDELFAPGREVILGDTEGGVGSAPLTLVVERTRPFKRGVLVKFEGYPDRLAVDPFAQRYVLLPIDELEPLEEGELYYHQLLGLEVVTTEGDVVGRVREVYETEPAHLLEVAGAEKVHLIPFAERIVKKVDLGARRVVIKPPPGLLEL